MIMSTSPESSAATLVGADVIWRYVASVTLPSFSPHHSSLRTSSVRMPGSRRRSR